MKIKIVVLSFLVTAFLSLNFVIPQLIHEHLQAYMSDIQQSAADSGLDLGFEDVRLSYIPLRVRISKLIIKTKRGEMMVSTDRVEFSNWSFSEILEITKGQMGLSDLTKLKISVQQLEMSESYLSPRLQTALSELGYEKLVLNIVSDYKYTAATKDFYLNELSIEDSKMGKLSVRAHLTEFSLPDSLDLKDLSHFDKTSVKQFSVEYVEHSLVNKIKGLAQKNNIPLDRYLVLSKKADSQRDPANTAELEIASGLQEFINNPQSVKLAVAPDQEIPFKDISLMIMLSPNKLIESLQPSLQINGSSIRLDRGN